MGTNGSASGEDVIVDISEASSAVAAKYDQRIEERHEEEWTFPRIQFLIEHTIKLPAVRKPPKTVPGTPSG